MTEHYGKGTAAERGIVVGDTPLVHVHQHETTLPHTTVERMREQARAGLIARNNAPVWPGINGTIVTVVEPGTVIGGFTVEEGVGVRKGLTFFVTQSVWDALMKSIAVKDVDDG